MLVLDAVVVASNACFLVVEGTSDVISLWSKIMVKYNNAHTTIQPSPAATSARQELDKSRWREKVIYPVSKAVALFHRFLMTSFLSR